MKEKLKVVELFAGVGGFRVGLGRTEDDPDDPFYQFAWANQWEPGLKERSQSAAHVYRYQFGGDDFDESHPHFNEDIEKVIHEHPRSIPEHDLLVGGFPCQDYSVAKTLNKSHGLIGQKGVLWWSIYNILALKLRDKQPVDYVMLENVDRLLNSPAQHKGRDFSIMLASLANLGYVVEWRIINAADYGMPQRRRRIFIMGYRKGTPAARGFPIGCGRCAHRWIHGTGLLAEAFPVQPPEKPSEEIDPAASHNLIAPPENAEPLDRRNLQRITDEFNEKESSKPLYANAGVMADHKVYTFKVEPRWEGEERWLRDIIETKRTAIPDEFWIPDDEYPKWEALKGAKSIERTSKTTGAKYTYDEGGMACPDPLRRAARTVITGEGGRTPSRFKHIIKHPRTSRHRRLTPIELERISMFGDDHTRFGLLPKHLRRTGDDGVIEIPNTKRAFFIGNALVVGVVERLGEVLKKRHHG